MQFLLPAEREYSTTEPLSEAPCVPACRVSCENDVSAIAARRGAENGSALCRHDERGISGQGEDDVDLTSTEICVCVCVYIYDWKETRYI